MNMTKQGAAGAIAVLDDVVPEFRQAVGSLTAPATTTLDEAERVDLWRFIDRNQQLRGYLLEHCHGTAAPGRTPDLLACKRMLDEYVQAGMTLMIGAGVELPARWSR